MFSFLSSPCLQKADGGTGPRAWVSGRGEKGRKLPAARQGEAEEQCALAEGAPAHLAPSLALLLALAPGGCRCWLRGGGKVRERGTAAASAAAGVSASCELLVLLQHAAEEVSSSGVGGVRGAGGGLSLLGREAVQKAKAAQLAAGRDAQEGSGGS